MATLRDSDTTNAGSSITSFAGYSGGDVLSSSQTFYNNTTIGMSDPNHSRGMVDYTISETGLKTTFVYDESGRQVQTTQDVDLNQNGTVGSGEHLSTVQTFDDFGRLDSTTDALGHVVQYQYDNMGRQTKTIFDDNTFTEVKYDDRGRKSATIDQLGRRTDYEYDDLGRLTAVTLPAISNTDQRRPRYEYGYDIFGNQTTITADAYLSADGTTVYYQHPDPATGTEIADGNRPLHTPYSGQVVGRHVFYNGSSFDTGGHDSAIAPDKIALLPNHDSSFANYTSYNKGINGIMVDMTGDIGTLSASDFVFKIGNDNYPGSWSNAPSPANITVRPGVGVGGSTRVEITWADNAIAGVWLQVTVKADDATKLANPDVFYFGNAIGEVGDDPNRAVVDALDQLTARGAATGSAAITNIADFNRDGLVNNTDENIARDNSTYFLTELHVVDIQVGEQTQFTYDYAGRQTSRRLPSGEIETFAYDGLGRQIKHVSFEGRVTTSSYDDSPGAGGRLSQTKLYSSVAAYNNGAGTADETITYSYDGLGRVSSIASSVNGTVSYTYDAEGQQTQVKTVSNGGARTDKINYEYNALGQLVRTYTGDVVGVGSSTNGDGKALTDTRYAYDQLGRLIQVSLVERNDTTITPETTKYYFDAVGNLADEVEANGVVAQYSYDGLNRLTSLVHFVDANHNLVVDSGETVLAKFSYTLNADGSRASESDFTDASTNVAMSYAWSYDGLNRIASETFTNNGDTASTYTDTFTFDMAGNRLTLNHDATGTANDYLTAYVYDSNDRLMGESHNASVDANDTFTAYSYGTSNHWTMQTQQIVSSGSTSGGTVLSITNFSFDDRGRLAGSNATAGGVTTLTSYGYDAAGNRITQTLGTGSTPTTVIKYTVDANNPTGYSQTIEERSTTGGVTTTKTYTIGLDVIAQYDTANAGNGTLTFLYDGHGSTRDMVGVIASVVTILQKYAYQAYGERISASNLTSLVTATLASLLYSGEQTDPSGKQFLRDRIYDPATGRFPSLDPFAGDTSEPQTLHKYLYACANPIGGIDPSGQCAFLLELNLSNGFRAGMIGTTLTYVGVFGAALTGLSYAIRALAPYMIALALSGVANVASEVSAVASDVVAFAAAMSAAIAAASKATGRSTLRLRLMPMWPVWAAVTPTIYAETASYLSLPPNQRHYVLTFAGLLNPQTILNRAWVRLTWGWVVNPASRVLGRNSLDEFPYASTTQGGPFGPAVGWPVPLRENLVQGGLLVAFYKFVLKGIPLTDFLVVPVP